MLQALSRTVVRCGESMNQPASDQVFLIKRKPDISLIIREERRSALAEDFNALKSELKSTRADITNNTAAMKCRNRQCECGPRGLEGWTIYMVGRSGFVTSYSNQPSNSGGNPKRQVRGH